MYFAHHIAHDSATNTALDETSHLLIGLVVVIILITAMYFLTRLRKQKENRE